MVIRVVVTQLGTDSCCHPQGAVVGVGGVLVGEAVLLLGEGGLGQERAEPVEVDHF